MPAFARMADSRIYPAGLEVSNDAILDACDEAPP
jgi:hypothetical protein